MKTKIFAILLISALGIYSCQKTDESATTDLSTALLKSASIAASDVAVQSASLEATYEADFYAGFEHLLRELSHVKGKKGNLMAGHGDLHYVQGEAPVVTIDTAAAGYPITINIAYGTGIETNHGKVISGNVKIVINGAKNTNGSTREITFDKCAIDTIAINGSSIEQFTGDNTTTRKITNNSNVTFTITDGPTLIRKGTETSEWLAGVATPEDRDDDKIVVTGSITVENTTDNITYSRIITDGLIKLGDCRNIVDGTVEYRQGTDVLATLDYGDGTCDDLASFTSGGTTTEVTLKGLGHMKDDNMKGGMKGGKGGGHK
jgi:hypothetical protein